MENGCSYSIFYFSFSLENENNGMYRDPSVHKGYWWHFSRHFVDRKNKRESYFCAQFWNWRAKNATSAWWRHCSETVFLRDNFVIFHLRSERILESVNFYVCLYANFQFLWWPRDHFLAPFRAYICQMPGHRLSLDQQKAHLQSLGFPSVPLVWGKTVSCRLCAG